MIGAQAVREKDRVSRDFLGAAKKTPTNNAETHLLLEKEIDETFPTIQANKENDIKQAKKKTYVTSFR